MASDRMAYDALQTAMARQRLTVYDLYGLLGVPPTVDEAGIRAAYDAIAKKLHPQVPSNVINVAYSILVNPFKRAQYDRDRLEYLYKHFDSHEDFPSVSASTPQPGGPNATDAVSAMTRDEQIQVYATTLVDRVKDPIEEKKAAIIRRIATIRAEVDEFNELSHKQRQDWATSGNRVLRMAGNALCEVVVCAEEDLRMLEDELGRVDGILAPRDAMDGPQGRVTSGNLGSDISAVAVANAKGKGKPSVLMGQRVPFVPRSPTVPIQPKSASRLGVQGRLEMEVSKDRDSPGSSGAGDAATAIMADDRVNNFLLGPTSLHVQPVATTEKTNVTATSGHTRDVSMADPTATATATATVKNTVTSSDSSKLDHDFLDNGPPGMGLVEWQKLNGARNPDENPENHHPPWAAAAAAAGVQGAPPADVSRPHLQQQPRQRLFTAPTNNFGFHVARPAERGEGAGGVRFVRRTPLDPAEQAAVQRWLDGALNKHRYRSLVSRRVHVGSPKVAGGSNGSPKPMELDDPFV